MLGWLDTSNTCLDTLAFTQEASKAAQLPSWAHAHAWLASYITGVSSCTKRLTDGFESGSVAVLGRMRMLVLLVALNACLDAMT